MTDVAFPQFAGYVQRTSFDVHPTTTNFPHLVSRNSIFTIFIILLILSIAGMLWTSSNSITIDGIDFKCWQVITLSIIDPALHAHGFIPSSQPTDENLVRSILQPLLPIYCPFFYSAGAVPKGLRSLRSTPARCAASRFRPTNQRSP